MLTCLICFVSSQRYWKKPPILKPTKRLSESSLCSKSARKRLWSASSGKRSPQSVMSCERHEFLRLGSSLVASRRFGSGLCSICLGDPQDPLCLPCDHIYCLACIKEWMCSNHMYCPLCQQQVNNDFQIVPSEAVRSVNHSKTPEPCCSSTEIGCLL